MLAGFTDLLFAYEIKVCMFRNATASSAQEPHTQRKLLPESCAELRNVVKVSVTIQVCCFLQKNIKTDSEYTLPVCTATVRGSWGSCAEGLGSSSEQCCEKGDLDTFT